MVLRLFSVLLYSVLSVIVLELCAAEKLDLPVPTCKRDSPDFNSCLKGALNEAWPIFTKGLPPEFKFPPLDPWFYEYQKGDFSESILQGEVIASNMTIEGFNKTRFKEVISDFTDDVFTLEINLRMPKVLCNGTAEANANLGGFRINGTGHFNLTLEGIRSRWIISGPVINDTWIINDFGITPTIKNLKVYLSDFFQGNREMNDLIVMFVNENWPPLWRAVVPIASQYWDTHFSELLTNLFAKLSFSKVFP